MIEIDLVKSHLRIDDDAEDDYLEHLIALATGYVTSLTKLENGTDRLEYDHACLLLIGHWYANREAASDTAKTKIPYGVSMLLTAIKPIGIGIDPTWVSPYVRRW